MSAIYKCLIKPLLFRLEPERAHELAIDGMAILARTPGLRGWMRRWNQLPKASNRPVEAFGLSFPNRVGLAAGFDKNAVCWPAFEALGFGHVEIGTVTALPQPGNPKPRMFRFPEQGALLNRMGFNNEGADAVAERLSELPGPGQRGIPLGINIGKSKVALLDQAVADYRYSFLALADYADYLVVNVSSPNTPDLRKLQEESRLLDLLGELQRLNRDRAEKAGKRSIPILLKIAPDLSDPQLDAILGILIDLNLAGIIATNTTMAREGLFASVGEPGGISGQPVEAMSTEIIARIYTRTKGLLPIIGVGGISSPDTAKRKIDAGATLVQIYTGMVYEGPFLAKRIARALAE
jgi:dihydroorotate dehydrogenase